MLESIQSELTTYQCARAGRHDPSQKAMNPDRNTRELRPRIALCALLLVLAHANHALAAETPPSVSAGAETARPETPALLLSRERSEPFSAAQSTLREKSPLSAPKLCRRGPGVSAKAAAAREAKRRARANARP